MKYSIRQKLTIISLLIYWSVLFILAHRPIPGWVFSAHVSDKSIHFLAYLFLVFLLWYSIRPEEKVSWRRITFWWVLLVMAGYGIADEWTQGFVGRQCDSMDFVANMAGIFTGLILFGFLTFWPAMLVVTGIGLFTLTNLAKANLAELIPAANVMFHLFGYGFFTMLWVRHIHYYFSLRSCQLKWWIAAIVGPVVLLAIVKLFSVILGRVFILQDVILAIAGIAVAVGVTGLTGLFCKYRAQN